MRKKPTREIVVTSDPATHSEHNADIRELLLGFLAHRIADRLIAKNLIQSIEVDNGVQEIEVSPRL